MRLIGSPFVWTAVRLSGSVAPPAYCLQFTLRSDWRLEAVRKMDHWAILSGLLLATSGGRCDGIEVKCLFEM